MSLLSKTMSKHWKHSLWIVVVMSLVTLLAMSILYDSSMTEQLLVVVLFSLLSAGTFVVLIRRFAASDGRNMMKLFLLHSTVRMLAAAALIWIYASVKGWLDGDHKKSLLSFVILFAAYYFILLIFDAVRIVKCQGATTQEE